MKIIKRFLLSEATSLNQKKSFLLSEATSLNQKKLLNRRNIINVII